MRTFYHILINSLIAGITNSFVWFALTFWAYLETNSVLATSIVSGVYLTANALSAFWFGSIVDHNKKKTAMLISSVISLFFFTISYLIYFISPKEFFTTINTPNFWILVLAVLFGVIAGNIRNITLPTIVSILVDEDKRDKANGLVGTTNGIAFAITSVFSGLVLAYMGMNWVLILSVVITLLAIIHLYFIDIPEKIQEHVEEAPKTVDVKGTLHLIYSIPGLFGLILFATFNNLLGGVFMSLMDAYGLTLVSLQVWGFIWGFLSLGFIFGGILVAKRGLGSSPLRTLFISNIIMWTVCIFFTIQASIVLLIVGMIIWICLVPFIEASEQTIYQKVVPYERLGRVMGIAQTIESAASPVMAFLIGPIAQFIFIPFMTTGEGVQLIGPWFGAGQGRGIALVFTLAGIIGLIFTYYSMKSKSYKLLLEHYKK